MDPSELFRNLFVMAAADGKLTDDEVAFLSKRAEHWGISNYQFAEALKYAHDPKAHLTIPPDHEQRRAMLCELIRLMGTDGELADVEKELFAVAAAAMEIPTEELDQILDELTGRKS